MENKYQNERDAFLSIQTESSKKAFTTIFNKSDEIRKKLGKELEEVTKDDVEVLLKNIFMSKSVNSLCAKVSMIKKYLNTVGNDVLNELTRSDLSSIIEEQNKNDNFIMNKYIPFEIVKKQMDNSFVSDIDKAIIILLNMGICEDTAFEQIRTLKISDIDLENNRLFANGKVYYFGKYEKNIFARAINEDEMQYGESTAVVKYNPNCPYLVKPRRDKLNNDGMNAYTKGSVTVRIIRVFNRLGLGITAMDIVRNSIVDKIIEHEDKHNIILSKRQMTTFIKTLGYNSDSYDIYEMKNKLRKNAIN